MRRLLFFISSLIITVGVASCKELIDFERPDDEDGTLNRELVTKNSGLEKVIPIGSVFVGGAVADPKMGSSHRCHFYDEAFTEGPKWNEVAERIFIEGFRHKGIEYTAPGQYIDKIRIRLDSSSGVGNWLQIPMNQGKYEGGCELVKDVKINSYKFSTYQSDMETLNDDAKIDIRIRMKDGTTLAILFAGKTPYDGYF